MTKKKTEPQQPQRDIDKYFNQCEQMYQHTRNKLPIYVSVLLMLFGLITLVWAIPFPHLQFLGRYNGFVNWASFLIAAWIYYYLRMSPVASYLMLFVLFAYSYAIIQLEQWQKVGGAPLWLAGLICLVIGLFIQWLLLKPVKAKSVVFIIVQAPLWLWVSVLKKSGFKY